MPRDNRSKAKASISNALGEVRDFFRRRRRQSGGSQSNEDNVNPSEMETEPMVSTHSPVQPPQRYRIQDVSVHPEDGDGEDSNRYAAGMLTRGRLRGRRASMPPNSTVASGQHQDPVERPRFCDTQSGGPPTRSKSLGPQSRDIGVMQRLISGGIKNDLLQVMATLPDYQPHVVMHRVDTSVMTKSSSTDILSVNVSEVRYLSSTTAESQDLLDGFQASQADSARSLSATTMLSTGRSSDSGAAVIGKPLVSARPSEEAVKSGHGPGCFCRHCFSLPSTSQRINKRKKAKTYDLPRLPAVAGGNDPNMPGWFGLDKDENYDSPEANKQAEVRAKSPQKASVNTQEPTQDAVSQSAIETQLPLPEHLVQSTSNMTLAADEKDKEPKVNRITNKFWQARKRFKPMDYIRAGFRHVNDLIQNDQDEGRANQARESEMKRLVREEAERNKKAEEAAAGCSSRDMFATETIDLVSDAISTDSDDSLDHPSLIRVQKHYSSASSITTGDLTDYSDVDDIRNMLFDDNDEDISRVRNDVILGKEPANYDPDSLPPVNLDNLKESFRKALKDHHRKLAWADRGPPEELPENIENLVHFPMENYVTLEPQAIFEKLLSAGAKHHVPLVFMDKVWRIICDLLEALHGERPLSFFRLRQKVIDDLPPATIHYRVQHKRTGIIRYVEGRTFRKKKYPASRYKAMVCETRTNLEDLMKYHAERHEGARREELMNAWKEKSDIPVHFFIDGVSPSTTGSKKMMCEVVQHTCCNLLMNYATFVYQKDYELTADDLLEGLTKDLHKHPNMKVKLILADMPERHRLLGLINHNGEFGCQICIAPGEKREGAPGIIWPPSTMGFPKRDRQSFETQPAATATTGLPVSGHKTRSPLLNLPNFSIVHGVPIDPMHLFCGLTKMFWEKFASSYLSKEEAKVLNDQINVKYNALNFPSDFKRDKRDIDPPKWRANEWKQLVALVGIDIGNLYIDMGFDEIGEFWLRYTWIMRMMAQGNVWMARGTLHGKRLRDQISILYRQVEKLLGRNACTPNLHALYHLPDVREQHRLPVISTEKAEAFYGINRRSFASQSTGIGKQIHVNTLLASKEGHACAKTFQFRPKVKDTDMDYLMVDNRRGVHALVGDDVNPDLYRVRKVQCMPYIGYGGIFNWRDCGVMRALDIDNDETTVRKNEIIARAILTNDKMIYIWTRDLHDF